MKKPIDLISITQARIILGVSTVKMAQLLKDGAIQFFPNPLDKRVKLVSKTQILSLLPKSTEAA
jgi:hypothetical protein